VSAAASLPLALVTGAGGGIGRAISLHLARSGWRLLLLGRRPAPLDAVAGDVRAAGGEAATATVDLVDPASITRFCRECASADRLELLVHCAGAHATGPWDAEDPEGDQLMQVNYEGPVLLTRGLLATLERGQGQIVFVNSSQGLAASPCVGRYAASKAALRAFADSLRGEVNARGVRVTSIFPGSTATPMQASIRAARGETYDPASLLQPDDVAAVVITAVSLPRTAEVTDIVIRSMRPPAAKITQP
jgi:NADP-dependent 3-hydroxy acid dehydrogenase YdfG